ncbi:MAG: hypothetical protein A3I07_00495 [Candidatus Doudnabacteria bacterium RIFCSPLOWO2_02_FULL_42_9]|uniref:PEP-utilising enzyme mobile domain-containing protein n=1 Tax=Candidatus Doudnabacteria bacterium RIFCSPHIGHO2_01_FULL_41_86 TaxID=1817821 RepID=A0A1F5N9C5_9BACT|nr:MAG: hypothetical protein A2717_01820 [Candidatus Doudnabacteria bacterium RIFCSPHIGHO2_01_FULL_41_86]OGE74988.1 MAG: hypothetical protein A3K07_04430 [Candidatus Doudnabacteria bacterium RIFCSPHIGHO2_01_43_10]OGE85305.1 MAG: hypothetical protein A3E28_01390 [Candidatus Doudnabacteria bacterium RIFCSPHIGHO2_12_FULL_42_22]OGE86843.1 MAG: hypothetical protein A3C49_02225 [Candidatus Doudnabacteria bacterium RIFCSPHIGHO2_02_FULL_42_25]OGE91512.1 MAG: hypothetical protein A3K08_02840 [Candidatus
MKPAQLVKKYGLNKLNWFRKGYHGVLHFHYPVHRAAFEFRKFFGTSHNVIMDFFDSKEHGEWSWCYEDSVRIRDLFIRKLKANPKYLDKLVDIWEEKVIILDRVIARVIRIDLKKLSNQELFEFYKKFDDAYGEEFSYGIAIQDPFTMTTEEFLVPHFDKVISSLGYKNRFIELYTILIQPVNLSFVKAEALDLAKIKLKKTDPKLKQSLLKEHSKKYFWIHSNYAYIPWLDATYFGQQLNKLTLQKAKVAIENTQYQLRKSGTKKKDLIKKLKLDSWSKTLIRVVEAFAYMQDERKKYSMMSNNIIGLFMKEYSSRLKISFEEMKYTYIDELPQLISLDKVKLKVLIKKRKQASAVVATRGSGIFVYEGPDAKKLKKLIYPKTSNSLEKISGMVASTGIAKGTVKVILTFQDMKKMKKGNIIIASMTRPEMISAMNKASAIVTDEGGITSHAAIISRELKIPCIIGTKVATRVFKDGDMVEVDANNGIVRKLR